MEELWNMRQCMNKNQYYAPNVRILDMNGKMQKTNKRGSRQQQKEGEGDQKVQQKEGATQKEAQQARGPPNRPQAYKPWLSNNGGHNGRNGMLIKEGGNIKTSNGFVVLENQKGKGIIKQILSPLREILLVQVQDIDREGQTHLLIDNVGSRALGA